MVTVQFDSLSRFRALPNAVRVQLVATLLNSASVIVKLFLPLLFLTGYSLDFATIGMLMAAYGVGCVSGAYAGGSLTNCLDANKLTAACLLVSGALTMWLWQLPPVTCLFVVVPSIGAADGAFRPANLRLVMEAGEPEDAAWLQGVHRIVFNFGAALAGAAAAGLVSSMGYPALFAATGVAGIAGSCLLMRYACAPARPVQCAPGSQAIASAHTTRIPSGSPWADRPFLIFVLGQLLALGVFDQMYSTLGIFLDQDYVLEKGWIGYLFSLNAALIVLLQAPVMILIGRIGVVTAGRSGILLLAIAFPVLNLGHNPAYAVISMVCLTAAELVLTPAWTLAVMARSANRDRGRYLGIFSATWLGHSLYGPAAGAWIYGAFGGRNLWLICAAVCVAGWVLHWRALEEMSGSAQ